MTRFILAICIVIGCTLCGRAVSAALRRRTTTLEGLVRGLRLLRVHMTGMFEPVQQSLSRSECELLSMVGGGMGPGIGAEGAWQAVRKAQRRRGGLIDALAGEDIQALDRLFSQLGTSGRDAQELLLNGVAQELEQNLSSARLRAAEADRLYVSLGLLTGLMLALIVI